MFSPHLKQIGLKSLPAVVFGVLVCWPLAMAQSLPPFYATPEEMLKPLVDTQQHDAEPQPSTWQEDTRLHGRAQKQLTPTSLTPDANNFPSGGGASAAPSAGSGTKILTGQVQTLQQAIVSENDVDWYAWYLSARDYLGRMGGLQCALGTPIKFYRDGRIEALSFNPLCQDSVAGRYFPLPANTRLDAIILPVRPGEGPPASRDEIYSRIKGGQSRFH
jgi:hypothetical protein